MVQFISVYFETRLNIKVFSLKRLWTSNLILCSSVRFGVGRKVGKEGCQSLSLKGALI